MPSATTVQRPPPARLAGGTGVGDDDAQSPARGRAAWGSPGRTAAAARSQSRDPQQEEHVNGQHTDAKGAKSKDLSHVPCKFYRANSCTAGKACPFSHDLTANTSKPICQWYAKGNCKFGHKCALAHILPGQPMAYDRRNKRAAQAAQREAQASGQVEASTSPSSNGSGRHSGVGQSLSQSIDIGSPRGDGDWKKANGALDVLPASPSWTGVHSQTGDRSFGSFSDGSDGGPLRPQPSASPTKASAQLPSSSSEHVFGSPSNGSDSLHPSSSLSAPSGLAQTLSQQLGTSASNRSSVAAQVMLSEQARRMSNTSDTLSPPRPRPALLSNKRPSYSGEVPGALAFGSSPPLTMPSGASGAQPRASPSIFGTSPFSASKGLFMPSSYDSNEDGFPRSPPSRGVMGLSTDMRRSSSTGWTTGVSLADLQAAAGDSDDEDDDDDGDGEGGKMAYDEGFLPSSLNDLLTPEEQRRRASRMTTTMNGFAPSTSGGSRSIFNPFMLQEPVSPALASRSVPADVQLARARPTPMPPSSASLSANAASWGTLSASAEGTNVAAAAFTPYSPPTSGAGGQRSLLSVGMSSPSSSTSLHPSRAGAGVYSSSFDPRFASSTLSSSMSTSPIPAPSGSLPGGLAAGLSQLHLIPPRHTGETPPTTSVLATPPPPAVKSFAAAAAGANGSQRSSSHLATSAQAKASPLARTVSSTTNERESASEAEHDVEEDDMQFSMDA